MFGNLGRRVRPRWASHIRPLLIVAGVLLIGQMVPSLVASVTTSEELLEDVEAASPEIGWTSAIESYRLAEDIEQRVNDERKARGLRPLVWHEGLADLARQWSEEMISTGYRHSPDSFRVLPDLQAIGENILMGHLDSGEAHVAWMLSDGHRENILRPEFTMIGIGVVCRNDGRIWATQMFGLEFGFQGIPDAAVPAREPIVRQEPGLTC